MSWFGIAAAAALILVVLIDAFEVIILPRRVRHGYRLAGLFYRVNWWVWRGVARVFPRGRWRNGFLGVFGPLSVVGLSAVWAAGLITGFALMHDSLGTQLSLGSGSDISFTTFLYFSATTFFTLGYGDIVPTAPGGRLLSMAESGIGFGFLAAVISYLPVLYQAFSRREITISLLDARAGSPPTAGELLRRTGEAKSAGSASALLVEWERWSAELLESHLSYPMLSFFRSQHDNQSWIATLTTILDTTSLLIAGVERTGQYQARLTFAMARHAAVDLALVFRRPPRPTMSDRLPEAGLAQLRTSLRAAGLELPEGPAVTAALTELRGLYEPFVNALAEYFLFPMPGFQPERPPVDYWQTGPRTVHAPNLGGLAAAVREHEHHD